MAEFYCDHGVYGTTNRLGIDVPTWGVPQDGDGVSITPSGAAAVAEIKIVSVPTASETIAIAGAVITAAATAGTNIFAYGSSTADTAANIVSLINSPAFTALVSNGVISTTRMTANLNQGRNLLYARVKPGFTDTVQIMWRIGSDRLNHATNALVAITSSGWASAPVVTQFAGGVGGCYGYLINDTAIGQGSSIAVGSYGVLIRGGAVVHNADAGKMADTDDVYIRTGAGKTISITNVSVQAEDLARKIFDSNQRWTGDSGNGVFILEMGATVSDVNFNAVTSLEILCTKKSNFTVRLNNTASGIRRLVLTASNSVTNMLLSGIRFVEVNLHAAPSTSAWGFIFNAPSAATSAFKLHNVEIDISSVPKSSWSPVLTLLYSTNYPAMYEFVGCDFKFNYSGAASPGALTTNAVVAGACVRIIGGSITGMGGREAPIFPSAVISSTSSPISLYVSGVRGAAISDNPLGLQAAFLLGINAPGDLNRRTFYLGHTDGSWRSENTMSWADWMRNASPAYPTLSAVDSYGIPWSIKVAWPTATVMSSRWYFPVPAINGVNRLSTGARTLLLEMLMQSAIVLDARHMQIAVNYINGAGNTVTEVFNGLDIKSSAAAWTGATSWAGYSARKLEVALADTVLQNSEVSIHIGVAGQNPTGSLGYIFIDPAIVLA